MLVTLQVTKTHAYKPEPEDSLQFSTIAQANEFLVSLNELDSSKHWPNIHPGYFKENLSLCLSQPLYAFDNKNTNFCGYTAISFLTVKRDPLAFVKFMVQLYQTGEGDLGKSHFTPSKSVKKEAGLLKYKGMMDIHPATQMWYLTLADHFKGYLNIFNRRYHSGDENTLWASTNYAKFNRMLRKLFSWKVKARGADLAKPPIDDLPDYLQKKLHSGTVFLYLNNRLLYKKKHVIAKVGIPTHYVLLQEIYQVGNTINIIYVDGGRKTHQQISSALLKKIVYGVTVCTPQ